MVLPCYRNVQRFALSLALRLALILVTGFAGPITSRIGFAVIAGFYTLTVVPIYSRLHLRGGTA